MAAGPWERLARRHRRLTAEPGASARQQEETSVTTVAAPLARRRFLAGGAAALVLPALPAAAAPASLDAVLADLRVRYRLPGIAALVLQDGRVAAQGVAGRRSATGTAMIRIGDPFVIGSCGKSMTATVVARLVERGTASFDTTLAAIFPELRTTMRPAYRTVTLAALLAHRGGLPANPPLGFPLPGGGTPREARARAVPLLLQLPPAVAPGTAYLYSNLGYTLVGAALERLTGQAFEALMARELFRPLGLASAGFLAPAGAGAPRGHDPSGRPLPPDSPLYPPRAGSPAGLYHLSLPDWARYARLHLGLGPAGYLRPATLARLHRPWRGPGERYALGWHVKPEGGRTSLWHQGSDGFWSARATLIPSAGYAILMATNILSPGADQASDALRGLLLRRFPPA
jgi:CubicO group peptidase (beta-lactamase class C family)